MSLETTFTVVGVRADGSRFVLASHAGRDAAERVLQRIGPKSEFSNFQLVLDNEWPPRLPKPAQRRR